MKAPAWPGAFPGGCGLPLAARIEIGTGIGTSAGAGTGAAPGWRKRPAVAPVRWAIATKSSAGAPRESVAAGPGPARAFPVVREVQAFSRYLSVRRFRGCLLQRPENVQILPKPEQETKEEAAQVSERPPPCRLPPPLFPGHWLPAVQNPGGPDPLPPRSSTELDTPPPRLSCGFSSHAVSFFHSPRPK